MKLTLLIVRRLILVGLAIASSLPAQPTYRFTPILFEPPAPTGRIDAPLVYDPQDRRLYMFGGQERGFLNDLWVYSFDQAAWNELQPSGGPPAGRRGHTMVFDAARRRLIVFGGQARGFFNDVWAYDIAANSWTRLDTPDSGPNTRYGHSAISDPRRDRMLVSHGFTDAGRFDDTWAFDYATNTWTDVSPAARPLRRCLHHSAYDPMRDQMLLYGGCASGSGPCPLGDLWGFNLETHTWTQLADDPPARQFYGVAFDPEVQRMIIFGGDGTAGRRNDVWGYDPATNAWSEPQLAGDPPSQRSRHQGQYVDGMGVVFFGGNTPSGRTNELWLLAALSDPPTVSAAGVANAFNFEGGAVAPGEIVSLFVENGGPDPGVAAQFGPDGLLPFSLAGVTVTWNGMPSPAYFVSKNQINVQVPYEKASENELELVVDYLGQSSPPVMLPVTPTKAGLFPTVFNQDGTVNSEQNPADARTIIVLFVSGQGVTSPPSPTGGYPMDGFPEPVADVAVEIAGQDSEVIFRGQAPFTAGVMQLNVRLGDGSGALIIRVRIGDAVSQDGVAVWVRSAGNP